MQYTLDYLHTATGGRAAIKIETPDSDARTPSHFICLVDVSESMTDDNKLENVKHCLKLLLGLLTPQDAFSLITFGDIATTHCKKMQMTPVNMDILKQSIDGLKVDGCTNLSAGLGEVNNLLAESCSGDDPVAKQGLLLLTDGHANRGISHDAGLRDILSRLQQRNPALSVNIIGYGTNHNAELLKEMAADSIGSYSIVESVEGAALAIGEALGGVLSCCAQNVRLVVPAGTTVLGPYKVAAGGTITLGDLYSGSQTMILLDLPAAEQPLSHLIRLQGTYMPSLDPFDLEPLERVMSTSPNPVIELTVLRYRCAELFRKIREESPRTLEREISAFEAALSNPLFEGHVELVQMLRNQVQSMRTAVEARQRSGGRNSVRFHNLLVQQEAFSALGRGASMPIQEEPTECEWGGEGGGEGGEEADGTEDPRTTRAAAAVASQYFLSPTSSRGQQRVARTLQRMTANRSLSSDIDQTR